MNKIIFPAMIALLFLCALPAAAQVADNPGDYMTAINNAHTEMNQKYMAYMSAAAHSRKAKKIEKLRQQVLETIENSRYKTIDIPLYKGDNSLRQSSIDYIKVCYNVFNEDYAKIVNMEDIAEQSYDEMQAYILLHEKTSEKLHEAAEKMNQAAEAFAAKYNITLVDEKSDLGEKLEEAGKVGRYQDSIYLIFFKCYWEDGEIVDAMNKGSLNQIEQGRTSLIRFADEGMATLDAMKPFENDPSLLYACKNILKFYKKTGEEYIPKQTDFFLKKENFEKIKKSFDDKLKKERTKEDVDAYNRSVNEMNNASKVFNDTNKELNEKRTSMLNDWNKAQQAFADSHVPHYK